MGGDRSTNMSGHFRGLLPLAALVFGCGALDRRDGSLVIDLLNSPGMVSTVDVRIAAGGRSFSRDLSLPGDHRITDFSAIPAGTATIAVILLDVNGGVLASRSQSATVEEHQSVTVTFDFSQGPAIVFLKPVSGTDHHIGDGLIPVVIDQSDRQLIGQIALSVRAHGVSSGETADLSISTDTDTYVSSVDPEIAGDPLPADIELDATACLLSDRSMCSVAKLVLTVSRHDWVRSIPSISAVKPVRAASGVLVTDLDAHLIELAINGDTQATRTLRVPIRERIAVSSSVAITVDQSGTLSTFLVPSLEDGLLSFDGATTGPILDPSMHRVLAGAGSSLLAFDLAGGAGHPLLQAGSSIDTPPLADLLGIAAVDQRGEIFALDGSGARIFSASAGAPVWSPPIRFADRLAVATSAGRVLLFDRVGTATTAVVFDGGGPIALPMVVTGAGSLVVAFDDRLVWIDGSGRLRSSYSFGKTITGAPEPYGSDDSVVIGLINGEALIAAPQTCVSGACPRRPRVLSKMPGTAFSPLVLPAAGADPVRILVARSSGDLEMLRPEEGF
jgi:hypothetical protein